MMHSSCYGSRQRELRQWARASSHTSYLTSSYLWRIGCHAFSSLTSTSEQLRLLCDLSASLHRYGYGHDVWPSHRLSHRLSITMMMDIARYERPAGLFPASSALRALFVWLCR